MNQIQKDLRELADNVDHYSNVLERVMQNLYTDASIAISMNDYERAGELQHKAYDVFVALCGIKELAELKQKGKL